MDVVWDINLYLLTHIIVDSKSQQDYRACELCVCVMFHLPLYVHVSSQSTPLHLAAGYNRVGVVEVLIKHGADVHAKDKGGLVPLHNACSYGHYDVAELLVKVGLNTFYRHLFCGEG